MLELDVGLSHVVTAKVPVVSTKARRAARRDLLSTISRLSLREGLSAPRFALRSRRRKLPYAIALLALAWEGRVGVDNGESVSRPRAASGAFSDVVLRYHSPQQGAGHQDRRRATWLCLDPARVAGGRWGGAPHPARLGSGAARPASP